ncbi:MAG: glycosyltransferase family 9 protein [Usitatibacter sp.]
MKILVVRRDNIGDLVLTTPVFTALRRHFPSARIEVLVNSYNAPILEGHPEIDFLHVYTKSKHRESRWDAFSEWSGRLRQAAALRAERFDHVLVPSPGFHPRQLRLARWLRPRHIAAFAPPGVLPRGIDHPVTYRGPEGRHHVVDTYRILTAFGIDGPPPPLRIATAPVASRADRPLIGVHVSSRRPRNRWPESKFAELIRALHERMGARFRLFWAPGLGDDPRHPGDDEKARRILEATRPVPVEPVATLALGGLIKGLASCDALVCSDGGAMHLAAALRKPTLCFFGDSHPWQWHPWGVPYRLLQPPSLDAADIAVEDAVAAFIDLARETELPHAA